MRNFLIQSITNFGGLRLAACGLVLATLSACGGGGGSSVVSTSPPVVNPSTTPTASITINGIAATGAPVTGAAITAQCLSGSGQTTSSADQGVFSISLPTSAAFPCLLELKKGTLSLHGVALQAGTANITPLTELQFAVAAANANSSAVYAAFGSATSQQATQYSAAALAAAWAKVKAKMLTLGMSGAVNATLNALIDPGTKVFAAVAGDAHDQLLDQLVARLAANGLTLASLVTQILSPANLAPTPGLATSSNGLIATFDATTSQDADGSIASFAWNFGEPASGAANTAAASTASHVYAAAGSYTATLTLTDNQGSGSTVATAITVAPTAAIATGKLNDTGISSAQCYTTGTNTLSLCTNAGALALNDSQDGMTGRDTVAATSSSLDGTLGFSYTKIGTSGQTLSASATSWACVKDNVTGLMWEVKTNDGGLRDWAKTYTNYDNTSSPQFYNGSAYVNPSAAQLSTSTNSIGYQTAVNATSLCGATDWRLPTGRELQSLVNYGIATPGPTIDATWFPNTQGRAFWSSSPYVGSARYAWYVGFVNGIVDFNFRSSTYYVRLVRAGQ